MLSDVVNYIEYFSPNVVAASNILVFLGGGYIALHSRVMPRWAVTCLWYLGLASLLNLLTFVIEWSTDQNYPLSHFQIGIATETLIHFVLACTVGLLFFHTVWKDFLGSRARKREALVTKKSVTKVPTKKNTVKKSIKNSATKKVLSKRPSFVNTMIDDLKKEKRLEF